MKKYIVEAIGTFFLLSGAALAGPVGASLALMVMIYAGGHISGAHYNPAITIAMLLRKKIKATESGGYFIAQFSGAILSALILSFVFDAGGNVDCTIPNESLMKQIAAELLGTFALAYVVLNVATARGTAGNSYFGLAIAATVLAMAYLFGRYSGGVFNPAVGLGLSINKSLCWQQLWIYFVAPVAGAVLGAIVFEVVNEADEDPESIPEEKEIRIGDTRPH